MFNDEDTTRECPHLDLIKESRYGLQLYLRDARAISNARMLIAEVFKRARNHYFRANGGGSGTNLCHGRVNAKMDTLVSALKLVKSHNRHCFYLFLSRYGAKHEWEDFKKKYETVFIYNRCNLWDLTLNMRHKAGHFFLFRRLGRAGIVCSARTARIIVTQMVCSSRNTRIITSRSSHQSFGPVRGTRIKIHGVFGTRGANAVGSLELTKQKQMDAWEQIVGQPWEHSDTDGEGEDGDHPVLRRSARLQAIAERRGTRGHVEGEDGGGAGGQRTRGHGEGEDGGGAGGQRTRGRGGGEDGGGGYLWEEMNGEPEEYSSEENSDGGGEEGDGARRSTRVEAGAGQRVAPFAAEGTKQTKKTPYKFAKAKVYYSTVHTIKAQGLSFKPALTTNERLRSFRILNNT